MDKFTGMWTYHPDLLATPVPRYTSYPTAAEFTDGPGSTEMAEALDLLSPGTPTSLYVHIPFCEKICWYCGCNTSAANRESRVTAYLDALHDEIALVAGRLNGRAQIGRIAFGGGSPNALAPADFLMLVETLRHRFDAAGAEISVEIDPRSFTREWAGVLGALGTGRVSLGVQTFSEPVQRAIGRVQPTAMIRQTVEWLRLAGVSSINFDLMYGLPGQSIDDLFETLAIARTMAPERIALFGYAHVPQLIARQQRIDASALPDATLRFDQMALGHEYLLDAGYRAIGFDHFAVADDPLATALDTGRLRRNFQGFTDDDAANLIGFGATSISSFADRILQSEKNSGRYRMLVSSGRLPQNRGIMRTADDRRRGAVIEALLCYGRADIAAIGDMPERLDRFIERGLVRRNGTVIELAEDALPYARAIAACFDAHRQAPGVRQFSNAV